MAELTPIHIKVRNTEGVLFEGDVDRITSYNEIGQFDIYPMHANFISIIKKGLILFRHHQKLQDIKFDQAVLKIKKDNAGIFLGLEELLVEPEKE